MFIANCANVAVWRNGFYDIFGRRRPYIGSQTNDIIVNRLRQWFHVPDITMIIADASVLIALAKIGRLSLLRDLYGEVAVGPHVKAEVVEGGRKIQAAEVSLIEAAFAAKWMREVTPEVSEKRLSRRILQGSRLHEGEAEAIALAASRKLMVLLDDKEARIVAQATEVQYMGTAGVLLEAFFCGKLDFRGLEMAIEDLSRVIWLSPDVVAEILRRGGAKR